MITCPPETQLSLLCAEVIDTWLNYNNPEDFELRKKHAIKQARANARNIISWHLESAGKSVFCDKSLPNLDHALLLAELFPRAKFICLYRHPMDFIISAIESCKFGYSHFGLYPYPDFRRM
jgi:hypothetical protein